MGLSSSKTKTQSTTSSTPYTPATPAINAGITAAQSVFNANQPTLAQNSQLAQNAFQQLAPTAFQTSPYVTAAQQTAQKIADGAYVGNNPGASTYSTIQGSTNPALAQYQNIIDGKGAGSGTLDQFSSGANVYDPTTQDYYKSLLDPSYATANPFLDSILAQNDASVSKQANQRFAAAGMGSGLSSAFADVLSKNLANSDNTIRYQNYNDASNRQLTAASQADSQYNTGRSAQLGAAGTLASNQLAATSGLGSTYNQQQQTQLAAAQAADASKNSSIQQMLTAAGLQPGLAAAQYAGVDPALSLLSASSTIPYAGLNAYAGALGSLAGQYGTTNSTGTSTSSGLTSVLGALGSLGSGIGALGNLGNLSKLSDIRAKRDISHIGTMQDGLGVYSYRYIGDDEPQIGVMAQEVEALRPWALGPEIGGLKTVNYGAL